MGDPGMRRREILTMAAAAVVAQALRPCAALAQPKYPERPIRLVIPFPPGGVYDAVGRPWADKVKSSLGTVVIENIGGAGGSLGAASVARAAADGYTLLLGGGGPLIINSVASSKATYDALTSFEPIDLLALTGLSICIHASVPAKNLNELIAYARSNPDKMSYGSAGTGSMNQLAGELFKRLAKLPDVVHVPYKGGGPAITDLIGGQIPMVFANVTGQIIELHRAGKIRIVAVTTPSRLIGASDIPTAIEQGLDGMISQNFVGLFAPAGTSKATISQIAQASRGVRGDSDYQRMLLASGQEPVSESGPASTLQFLKDELARWTPIIKSIGLRID
jgi:tripartite-type tricarboxylate transporter receptor subunit TctC